MLKAILWDVDGTLAETERDGHLKAFNQAFEILELPWRWSDDCYAELLAVAGGRERLLHDMTAHGRGPRNPKEREALAEGVHQLKNQLYSNIAAGGALPLRDGVRALLEDCRKAAVTMGIVTTTSRPNVEALLGAHLGPDWESRFAVVICAREAPNKKPHPQGYLSALETLDLLPHEAVAIEDAPAGVAAAQAAGVPVMIARSHYFASADSPSALAAGPSLGRISGWRPAPQTRTARIDLEQINRWYARSAFARLATRLV
jgi:HAD superfamily hydrolase (TIGR01509 family)